MGYMHASVERREFLVKECVWAYHENKSTYLAWRMHYLDRSGHPQLCLRDRFLRR